MMRDPIPQYKDAIAAAGLTAPDTIETDGSLHRFSSNGKADDKAGWYIYHDGDLPAGAFGCWRLDVNQTWRADIGRKLTPSEEAAHKAKVKAMQKQREEAEAVRREEAAQKAGARWVASRLAESHPYLAKKGIRPHGIKEHDGNLIIPLRTGKDIHSLQTIQPDGTKRFMAGGRISGCYYSIGKPGQDNVMCIVEGFATGASIHEAAGHPVAVAFNAGNLEPVAKAMRERFHDMTLVICADDDYRTEGNPGITKATEAARAVNGIVAIPGFGDIRPEGATDFNDLHQHKGIETVQECLSRAIEEAENLKKLEIADDGTNDEARTDIPAMSVPEQNQEEAGLEEEIARLAALTTIQYAKERKASAKALGIGMTMLDSLIKEVKEQESKETDSPFAEVEPWEEPVNPDELFSEIATTIRRFIVCEPETIHAATLWTAMTWFMDVVQVAPLAVITAPEKRCGKSQLLFLLGRMVCKPLAASNITPAALFRSIDKWQPTLLIDEADAFMRENEELRGLLNCGHTRESAYSIRVVGENHTPTSFNLWGAKALAGIGHLADTLMDRAIVLELRRRLPCEHVERLRHADENLFHAIQRKLARFAEDHRETIRHARPDIPEALHDRAQDNWEPLLAIADTAGEEWSALAREAALKLSGDNDSTQSRGVELLADIQEVFEAKKVKKILFSDLVETLCEDSEKPWATYNRGKPVAPRQIGRLLSGYGIKSIPIRDSYKVSKGFNFEQFTDAFQRYLFFSSAPSENSVTRLHFDQTALKASADAGFRAIDPICNRVTGKTGVSEKNILSEKNPSAENSQIDPPWKEIKQLPDGEVEITI